MLDDVKIHVRLKLSALWASVVLCYIYGDYFELYEPGKTREVLNSQIGPLGPATQGVLLGTSLLMAIPSVMVFLSVALPPRLCRWVNVALGAVYTVIMILCIVPSRWTFYVVLGLVEIVLTGLVVWYAWRWPKLPGP